MPEIQRTSLGNVVLLLKSLGYLGSPSPPEERREEGLESLIPAEKLFYTLTSFFRDP